MKIAIAGTGYVGLSTGVGFAIKGNNVICMDVDSKKVDEINSGIAPIYEPGLEDALKDVLSKGRLRATTDIKEAVHNTEISFISVGTPSKEDGSIDLKFIKSVAKDIGKALKDKEKYHVIVVKSTVVPGTTENIVLPLIEEHSGKKAGKDFGIAMNPEFLREGKALEDFLNPDRIVIGGIDKDSCNVVRDLYKNFNAPIMVTNPRTAEMIKYTNNAFLATKISFANEIGNICKQLKIDTYEVFKGVSMDHRISPHFFNAGVGFGGSCFPKDVKALVAKAKEVGREAKILKDVIKVNESQRRIIVEMLENRLGSVKGKRIAVLGLAFKPDSDDIRESPAIDIIGMLKNKHAIVCAYDPKAMENMKRVHGDIEYAKSAKEALKDSDACLILTDWEEFKKLSKDDFELMRGKVIIEGRRVLSKEKGIEFEGICW